MHIKWQNLSTGIRFQQSITSVLGPAAALKWLQSQEIGHLERLAREVFERLEPEDDVSAPGADLAVSVEAAGPVRLGSFVVGRVRFAGRSVEQQLLSARRVHVEDVDSGKLVLEEAAASQKTQVVIVLIFSGASPRNKTCTRHAI